MHHYETTVNIHGCPAKSLFITSFAKSIVLKTEWLAMSYQLNYWWNSGFYVVITEKRQKHAVEVYKRLFCRFLFNKQCLPNRWPMEIHYLNRSGINEITQIQPENIFTLSLQQTVAMINWMEACKHHVTNEIVWCNDIQVKCCVEEEKKNATSLWFQRKLW